MPMPPSKLTPTYQSWKSMRARCRSLTRNKASLYAGRGIKVCERWDDFKKFLADMGERPEGTSIDRWPNPNGNYEPGNCRWATSREQARNTRRNKLTLEMATEIAVRRLRGERCKDLAAEFGLAESGPSNIARGECWPDALEAAKQIIANENLNQEPPHA